MEIHQVSSFIVQRHVDKIFTEVRRNPFSVRGDEDAFVYQQSNQRGEILRRFTINMETAALSLRKALELEQSRSDLISVEIAKLTTGISFNYPSKFL